MRHATFTPTLSLPGGFLIGIAAGGFMVAAHRVTGCSGSLKGMLRGDREGAPLGFLAGLFLFGFIASTSVPRVFEPLTLEDTQSWIALICGGFLVGFGASKMNGCTSGHGICGLSRISARSLVATPLFMSAAAATATARSVALDGTPVPCITPVAGAPDDILVAQSVTAAALLVGAVGLLAAPRLRLAFSGVLVGAWAGLTFGAGLAYGGMVRPTAVIGALTPTCFDPTLWVLFTSALATAFVVYRVAEKAGISEARAEWTTRRVDSKLAAGAILFGIGWGLTGVCPGPLVVSLGATLTLTSNAPGYIALFLAVATGMLAEPVHSRAVEGWWTWRAAQAATK